MFISSAVGSAGIAQAQELSSGPLSPDALSLNQTPLNLSSAAPGRSVAQDATVRIRGFGLYSVADGSIDFDSEIPGIDAINNIDFEDTLGMDLENLNAGAMIGFSFGGKKQFHLDLTYWGYYEFDGSRDVGSLVFDGNLFQGEVDSSAELIEGDIDFRWDLWKPETTDVTASLILGLNTYYIHAELSETATGKDDSISLLAPVPVLGGSLRWGITTNLYLQGSAAGIYAGSYGGYFDLSAEVGYDFNRTFGIFAGYRYWSLDLNWDDDEYDLSNGSAYAGVEVRF